MLPRRAFLAALAALLALPACTPGPQADFKGTDITGAEFGGSLALTDHHGRPRTLADFKGKLVVLFFGYTHCPDVCPTTLSDMAAALKRLTPEQAGRVQVLFVTVDPERDTAELLRDYVPYFHPDFLGLRGSPAETLATAKAFRIHYRKHIEPGATDYLIDHTAGSYVLDTEGRLRLFQPFAQPPEDIAHDLAQLLGDPPPA